MALDVIKTYMDRAARLCAVPVPSNWFTTTDYNQILLFEEMVETVEEMLARWDWKLVAGQLIQSTTATSVFALPSNFFRLSNDANAVFELSPQIKPIRPLPDSADFFERVQRYGSNTWNRYYRLTLDANSPAIQFDPPFGDGNQFSLMFITNEWVHPVTGFNKTGWTLDTDKSFLPMRIIMLGTIWRWRRHKGLEYASRQAEYEREIARYMQIDQPRRIIDMTGTCDRPPWDGDYFVGAGADGDGGTTTPPTVPLAPVGLRSSITQNGITINFETPVLCGQYCSGRAGDEDWFVDGSVVITSTSHPSINSGGTRWINGLMINPGNGDQGLDQGPPASYITTYTHALNQDPGALGTNLTVAAGNSVVKAVSLATPLNNLVLQKFIVMTVVDVVNSTPSLGSFRPPVYGTDKASYWREADLDYTVLRDQTFVTGTLTPASVLTALNMDRPAVTWQGISPDPYRVLTPTEHTGQTSGDYDSGYGQYRQRHFNMAISALHTNYTDAEKRNLLVAVVQRGIDHWGYATGNGTAAQYTAESGGTGMGRLHYVVTAAAVLDAATIKTITNAVTSPDKFSETRDLLIVGSGDVAPTRVMLPEPEPSRETPFAWTADEIGLPDYSFFYGTSAQRSSGIGPGLSGSTYRAIVLCTEAFGWLACGLMTGGYAATGGDSFKTPYQLMDRTMKLVNDGFVVGQYNDPTTTEIDCFNAWRADFTDLAVYARVPERPYWWDADQGEGPSDSPPAIVSVATINIMVNAPLSGLDGGSAITAYDIRYREKHTVYDLGDADTPGTAWTTITNITLPHTFAGVAAKTYHVQVRAKNAIGIGAWSDSRANRVREFTRSAFAGSFAVAQTVTNTVTGATAKIAGISGDQITLYDVFGTFNNGNAFTTSGGGSGTVTLSNAGGTRWGQAIAVT